MLITGTAETSASSLAIATASVSPTSPRNEYRTPSRITLTAILRKNERLNKKRTIVSRSFPFASTRFPLCSFNQTTPSSVVVARACTLEFAAASSRVAHVRCVSPSSARFANRAENRASERHRQRRACVLRVALWGRNPKPRSVVTSTPDRATDAR